MSFSGRSYSPAATGIYLVGTGRRGRQAAHMFTRLTCRRIFSRFSPRISAKMDTPYPPQIVHSNMSTGMTFIQRFSPVTGKMEWVQQTENYDYHQEVARYAFSYGFQHGEKAWLFAIGWLILFKTRDLYRYLSRHSNHVLL